jgi:putative transposase
MPRTARASQGDIIYHVTNRGNGRARVFHKPEDYLAFLKLIEQACERLPMRVLGFCLMPNHIHLQVWPWKDGDLSRWMQWLLTAHVRRYHRHHGTSGHVWQGRFKAFPTQDDFHLLIVLRYIERNPLRARLVKRAEAWDWCSLPVRRGRTRPRWLTDPPQSIPREWTAIVNEPQSESEEAAVRNSIRRGAPLGDADWQKRVARQLGLESSLRPIGRPRKVKK